MPSFSWISAAWKKAAALTLCGVLNVPLIAQGFPNPGVQNQGYFNPCASQALATIALPFTQHLSVRWATLPFISRFSKRAQPIPTQNVADEKVVHWQVVPVILASVTLIGGLLLGWKQPMHVPATLFHLAVTLSALGWMAATSLLSSSSNHDLETQWRAALQQLSLPPPIFRRVIKELGDGRLDDPLEVMFILTEKFRWSEDRALTVVNRLEQALEAQQQPIGIARPSLSNPAPLSLSSPTPDKKLQRALTTFQTKAVYELPEGRHLDGKFTRFTFEGAEPLRLDGQTVVMARLSFPDRPAFVMKVLISSLEGSRPVKAPDKLTSSMDHVRPNRHAGEERENRLLISRMIQTALGIRDTTHPPPDMLNALREQIQNLTTRNWLFSTEATPHSFSLRVPIGHNRSVFFGGLQAGTLYRITAEWWPSCGLMFFFSSTADVVIYDITLFARIIQEKENREFLNAFRLGRGITPSAARQKALNFDAPRHERLQRQRQALDALRQVVHASAALNPAMATPADWDALSRAWEEFNAQTIVLPTLRSETERLEPADGTTPEFVDVQFTPLSLRTVVIHNLRANTDYHIDGHVYPGYGALLFLAPVNHPELVSLVDLSEIRQDVIASRVRLNSALANSEMNWLCSVKGPFATRQTAEDAAQDIAHRGILEWILHASVFVAHPNPNQQALDVAAFKEKINRYVESQPSFLTTPIGHVRVVPYDMPAVTFQDVGPVLARKPNKKRPVRGQNRVRPYPVWLDGYGLLLILETTGETDLYDASGFSDVAEKSGPDFYATLLGRYAHIAQARRAAEEYAANRGKRQALEATKREIQGLLTAYAAIDLSNPASVLSIKNKIDEFNRHRWTLDQSKKQLILMLREKLHIQFNMITPNIPHVLRAEWIASYGLVFYFQAPDVVRAYTMHEIFTAASEKTSKIIPAISEVFIPVAPSEPETASAAMDEALRKARVRTHFILLLRLAALMPTQDAQAVRLCRAGYDDFNRARFTIEASRNGALDMAPVPTHTLRIYGLPKGTEGFSVTLALDAQNHPWVGLKQNGKAFVASLDRYLKDLQRSDKTMTTIRAVQGPWPDIATVEPQASPAEPMVEPQTLTGFRPAINVDQKTEPRISEPSSGVTHFQELLNAFASFESSQLLIFIKILTFERYVLVAPFLKEKYIDFENFVSTLVEKLDIPHEQTTTLLGQTLSAIQTILSPAPENPLPAAVRRSSHSVAIAA